MSDAASAAAAAAPSCLGAGCLIGLHMSRAVKKNSGGTEKRLRVAWSQQASVCVCMRVGMGRPQKSDEKREWHLLHREQLVLAKPQLTISCTGQGTLCNIGINENFPITQLGSGVLPQFSSSERFSKWWSFEFLLVSKVKLQRLSIVLFFNC